MNKLPTIPMTEEHQRLVLSGRKTLTSRRQRYAPGVYRMTCKCTNCRGCGLVWDGADQIDCPTCKSSGVMSLGCLEVVGYWEAEYWPDYADGRCEEEQNERLIFAHHEGYDTVAEFEAAARKIAGGPAFLDGKVALIPHMIRAVESDKETPNEVD